MTNHKQIEYLTTQEPKVRLVKSRRTLRRFNPKIFIDHAIETIAIASLLFTGFAGVGALACWGLEIIELNTNPNIIISNWYYQKNACLGGILVSFSAFLGSSLLGASLGISRDNFSK
ncbi:hypothetical protein FNW02_36630 [Komarekiella sp. 'clone 1']|uniref:Uncharacterized protein n=1 Tax=Komarekiella delphini-convector SJRDD-AB1 TaxID=2593771 RepID=A0AA40VVN0_9NOST|nr:hypothetical protein [Komarekiella delphini-convector]MBD6621094.1 hypothetical protein [Komarekiella delphini-convector SJRDD-AB1]